MGKVTRENADCLKRPVCRGTVLLKDEVARDLTYMADRNCFNSITLRLMLLANFDSVIDKTRVKLV